jgi:hypothetical protein
LVLQPQDKTVTVTNPGVYRVLGRQTMYVIMKITVAPFGILYAKSGIPYADKYPARII